MARPAQRRFAERLQCSTRSSVSSARIRARAQRSSAREGNFVHAMTSMHGSVQLDTAHRLRAHALHVAQALRDCVQRGFGHPGMTSHERSGKNEISTSSLPRKRHAGDRRDCRHHPRLLEQQPAPPRRRSAPSPIGRGVGEGLRSLDSSEPPHPNPLPQGRGSAPPEWHRIAFSQPSTFAFSDCGTGFLMHVRPCWNAGIAAIVCKTVVRC